MDNDEQLSFSRAQQVTDKTPPSQPVFITPPLVGSLGSHHSSTNSDPTTDDDANDIIVSPQKLKHLIKDQAVVVAVAPILLLINGLPQSGKSAAIETLLAIDPLNIKPQSSTHGLSFYEVAAVGVPSRLPNHIDQLLYRATKPATSYLHIMQSAIEHYHQMRGQTILYYHDASTMPSDQNFFHSESLNTHLKHTLSQLDKQKQEQNERKQSQSETQSGDIDWDRCLANGTGVALINIWDIGLSYTVYHLLPALYGLLDNSYSWLFFDLQRDSEHFYEPPVPAHKINEQLMKRRTRVHYFLRYAKLNESALPRKNVCSIFAKHDGSLNSEEIEQRFANCRQTFAIEAAKIGVQEIIDIDKITPIQPDDKNCAAELRKKADKLVFEGLHREHEIKIPLSFIFLRSLYYKDDTIIYADRKEVRKLADELRITANEFKRFCKFFTSFGSIIDVSLIDTSSEYIILKPNLFLKELDKIFCSEDDKLATTGILTTTKSEVFFGLTHAKAFTDILVSFNLAIKLKPEQIESQLKLAGDAVFYIPEARTTPPLIDVDSELRKNALRVLRSLNGSLGHFQVLFVDKFLKSNQHARIYIPPEEEASSHPNATTIRVYDSHQKNIDFRVVYLGFVVEFQIEKVNEEVCTQIIRTCHDIFRQNEHEKTNYNFSVLCSKNPQQGVTHELTRERHLLPNDDLCEECQRDGRKNALLNMWNAILRKDGMAVSSERIVNGDPILLDDAYAIARKMERNISSETQKEVAIRLGFTEEEYQTMFVGLLEWKLPMMILIEWERKLKRKENYSKRFLARKLMEIANEKKPDDNDCKTLEEIARLLDNEVFKLPPARERSSDSEARETEEPVFSMENDEDS